MKNLLINNLFNFEKKIILITGSSGQLGTSFSKLFLSQKAIVVGMDIKKSKFKDNNFFFYKFDISNKKKVEKNLRKIISKFKKIDIIINNASISVYSKFDKRNDKEINNTLNSNLKGSLNLINTYFKEHKKMKLKKCNIINIGSIYGFLSPDFRIYGKKDNYNSEIYGASKAAIIQLTKYYCVALSKYNISVNCISPGGIFNEKKPQSKFFLKKYSSRVPKNRIGKVSDLFTALLFLSSEHSDYVNGQNIVVDGGLSSW
tara:strand:- start:846 stop:1622 length:777 start_codon:yes stop_codon:yes gene_type:complete